LGSAIPSAGGRKTPGGQGVYGLTPEYWECLR
jgi:hypothetical protein